MFRPTESLLGQNRLKTCSSIRIAEISTCGWVHLRTWKHPSLKDPGLTASSNDAKCQSAVRDVYFLSSAHGRTCTPVQCVCLASKWSPTLVFVLSMFAYILIGIHKRKVRKSADNNCKEALSLWTFTAFISGAGYREGRAAECAAVSGSSADAGSTRPRCQSQGHYA